MPYFYPWCPSEDPFEPYEDLDDDEDPDYEPGEIELE